ncbi:MAG: acyl-ACP--UDP-N-acetylglucosamine O-acyltransferase [Gemmatales bacterium]|nr:acyl-ACP--UDP-N-acetylglucosamine O-acyltransferase [Gemmatales bacterium]MCS7158965.1 acyl-ACP--UDP-N-acetylglucosamine O-acyltransferase [Gemmatales bacterium]MDW8174165.1 acyl-ACP--UDP-N-acetylglucosamine O-acyltransferase [Gemmatales bacterium]MDW8223565.1 acyl-ACP--UDP-N-acetylglucosamine O-acyltransferase [Gemmatales bacterium]
MNSEAIYIHPTAIVSGAVHLEQEVRIGPYTIIEGPVAIGQGTVIGPHCHILGPCVIGRKNLIGSNVVIGGRPQDQKYRGEDTRVEIGDENVIRENVTIHRGTGRSGVTRIGHRNFLMVGCHIAHDCIVGNDCTLANNALLGGHCTVEDLAYISGNAAVHQYCRLGRLSLLSGCSAVSKDVPPFIIQQGHNTVRGINVVGMRRAGLRPEQIDAIRRLYHIMYLQSLSVPNALARIEAELGHLDVVREFVRFVRGSKRGICGTRAGWADAA